MGAVRRLEKLEELEAGVVARAASRLTPPTRAKEGEPRIPLRTRVQMHKYLSAYAYYGTHLQAQRASGVHRENHYNWLKVWPLTYAPMFDDAQRITGEVLEETARKRAVDGWDEPVFYEGEVCGHIRKYSDRMLELTLKGNPMTRERYRDKWVLPAGVGAVSNITQNVQINLANMSNEQIKGFLATTQRLLQAPAPAGAREDTPAGGAAPATPTAPPSNGHDPV